MKRFFLFGLFFVLLFLLCSPVDAQEGCGRWIHVMQDSSYRLGRVFYFPCYSNALPGEIGCPDSVWLPQKCDPNAIVDTISNYARQRPPEDTACWHWEERWVRQQCMRPWNPMWVYTDEIRDTCYQLERYRVYYPCGETPPSWLPTYPQGFLDSLLQSDTTGRWGNAIQDTVWHEWNLKPEEVTKVEKIRFTRMDFDYFEKEKKVKWFEEGWVEIPVSILRGAIIEKKPECYEITVISGDQFLIYNVKQDPTEMLKKYEPCEKERR